MALFRAILYFALTFSLIADSNSTNLGPCVMQSLLRILTTSWISSSEIDCFDLAGGNKLIYQKKKTKKILSKKHLLDSLKKYLQNDDKKAEDISEYNLNTREETINENITRKNPK